MRKSIQSKDTAAADHSRPVSAQALPSKSSFITTKYLSASLKEEI